MFSGASNLAEGVDRAFLFIFSVAFVFIVGITVFMIYTVIKFNRKKGIPARQFSSSVKLEILWTAVPLVIVMLMFYYGWVGFAPMRKPPKDAMVITAIGRKWEWEFDYGNGMKSKELVLPVNKAVRIELRSEDVNHSFYIPAFRVKEDVIPGYENFLWFIPNYIGDYEILCTEYCGLLHSAMLAKAVVKDEADYEKWFAELKKTGIQPDPPGFIVLRNTGCLACHSVDGAKLVGPTFKGLFGSQRKVNEGGTMKTYTADEEFVKNAIYEPDSRIADGFNKGLMKSYTGTVSDDDLKAITDYLKTLSAAN
ncbi:MAG: cytochrome c oxidase subunit II [Bacteroidales bacterium]